MKKISDYIHFYLGCEVEVKRKNDTSFNIGRICEVTRKSNHGDWVKVWFDDVITTTSNTLNTCSSNSHHFFMKEDSIKPILRPLSDLNELDFYSWFVADQEDVTLVKCATEGDWLAAWYSNDDILEMKQNFPDISEYSLIYEAGEVDQENVFCCSKLGIVTHGCSDEYTYFLSLQLQASWVNHLRKRGIDCDGLIEAGLAIDKTKI